MCLIASVLWHVLVQAYILPEAFEGCSVYLHPVAH